jgi:AcrR family transcriptional regulator
VSPNRIQLTPQVLLAAIGDGWPSDQVDEAIELLADSDGRFPPGARKLPSGLIRAVQRQRLLAAMLRAASILGYRETNVQDVIDFAGVSRPTFYDHFANKEDCFLAAFDGAAASVRGRVAAATAEGEGWRDRLRLALGAILAFAATEPEAARTLVVEARAASPEAALRRVALLDGFAACLDAEARELLPDAPPNSPITAAGIVGGIEAVLYARLCKGEHEDLEDLLSSLMYFVVLPYEGHEAASEELRALA